MVVCHYRKIIFIHIPKTGGTSIENILYNNNYIYIDNFIKKYFTKYFNRYTNNIFIHNIIKIHHATYLQEKYKNKIYFTCVRHPQSRLVSLYKFLHINISFEAFVIDLLTDNSIYKINKIC